MTPEFAQAFAEDWVQSWNAHDLEGILKHYHDEVTFTSPFARLMANPSGTVAGKDAVRDYFTRALAAYPELNFELLNVFVALDSVVLYYRSVLNLHAAEFMEFNSDGLVVRTVAHYTKA